MSLQTTPLVSKEISAKIHIHGCISFAWENSSNQLFDAFFFFSFYDVRKSQCGMTRNSLSPEK